MYKKYFKEWEGGSGSTHMNSVKILYGRYMLKIFLKNFGEIIKSFKK